jgi:hypothetical protein
MDNLRQLLVAIAALTLLFSVVSGANPNYFAGHTAFADDDEDEDDDSRSSDYDNNSDRREKDERNGDEQVILVQFGTSSKVMLEIDDEIEDDEGNTRAVEADLKIRSANEDLESGEHDVSFVCETPDFEHAFDNQMEVDEEDGEFEGELLLVNGTTYEDCLVSIGDLDVELPNFAVSVYADRDEDDDESGRDDDDERDDSEKDDNRGHENKIRLKVDDDEVEIEVKTNVTLDDGTYDAIFTCEEPDVDMTLGDSLKVEDGEAELEADLELAVGSYEGCKLESQDKVIASFDAFAVREGEDDNDDDSDVDEKRKEKRKAIVEKIRASGKRINASPESTGDYRPGWNYTLGASGIGAPRGDSDIDDLLEGTVTPDAVMEETEVDVEMEMGVWKSNRALVLLSIQEGTVKVDDKTYTVELGFALYSVNHNVMRLGAFVSDEDGNIYKLKLRGIADDDTGFPQESGDSIDMVFEGNSGPARNSFSGWELDLRGTVEAG